MTAAPLSMAPVWARPRASASAGPLPCCHPFGGQRIRVYRAAGRACARPAVPAVPAQHSGHLRRGRAGLPFDLGPAVPQRLLPRRGGGVVPGLVLPLVLGLMREPPVELDHHAVGLVHAVAPAPPPALRGERHLPSR